MAFLALNELDPAERAGNLAPAFFSLGSIVIGLHYVGRHHAQKENNAKQAVRFQYWQILYHDLILLPKHIQCKYLKNVSRLTGSSRAPKLLSFFLCLPLVLLS
jgi:hypothetical protein